MKNLNAQNKITDEEAKYYCAFSYLDAKPIFKTKLLEYFDFDIKRAYHAQKTDLQKLAEKYDISIPRNFLEKISSIDPVESAFKAFSDKDVKLLKCSDEKFPKLLLQTPDYPISLYYKGNLENFDFNYNLAVVGSRKATESAKNALNHIIKGLKNTNITIISGLAYGIDAQAHKSALENNIKTIGVIGSGLDITYPSSNKLLYAKIIKEGAIFSEYPLKTRPEARNFPQRNRIITGMSKGTLVAEAQLKSGAMISANLALDYNREVMCIPGNILNPNTQGIYHLIENGASIVTNTNDLLNSLGWDIILKDPQNQNNNLSEIQEKIMNIVSYEAKNIDEIAYLSKEDISSVMVGLTELELKGLIKQANNKYYKI